MDLVLLFESVVFLMFSVVRRNVPPVDICSGGFLSKLESLGLVENGLP